ncbi:tetratricopeptide repeat protein [Fusobacterium mortiferum]|jgi:tetratricopeptide (TPR) repeat protein|uniref:tetratricopeptide repeat protein n=1 Tax=Fusobacterium mortiferum TaxID=850 RepID=UPI00195A658B|nr:tetratricopeptide repeat protein [Fusobacterium mortiferum]MBM6822897.1 tetratricopeptide repeat protein [Fusobacterium mortiferum]
MKRILGVFILITSLVYGEGLLFWNENSEEKAQIEAKKQEMALRWKKIKELDKKISFDKNKENLEKNYKKYVEEFNIYLEYIKQDSEELFKVGDYYFKDGRYEKAYEVFSQDNTNLKNVFGAATTARFLSEYDKSLKLYTQAINMAPDFYESYLGRGIVNRNIKNYSEAIEDFKKYMEYKKDEAVYTGLGDLYMVTGNYQEAKKVLEVARNRYPNSKVIKDMLIRVYAELKS